MRLVLDTDVVIAGFVSPTGAARVLLTMVLRRQLEIAVSTTLFVEYESVLTRMEHLKAADATVADVHLILDGLAGVAIPVAFDYRWRPTGADADDEFVVETAVNGQADTIATYNLKHLRAAALRYGIHADRPGAILRTLRS